MQRFAFVKGLAFDPERRETTVTISIKLESAGRIFSISETVSYNIDNNLEPFSAKVLVTAIARLTATIGSVVSKLYEDKSSIMEVLSLRGQPGIVPGTLRLKSLEQLSDRPLAVFECRLGTHDDVCVEVPVDKQDEQNDVFPLVYQGCQLLAADLEKVHRSLHFLTNELNLGLQAR